ncbi:MAG: RCC1 domain-containing protein [Terrimicrobiaceae bacterium]
MPVDKTTLQSKLTAALGNTTNTTVPSEVLGLILSAKAIDTQNISVVSTSASLPDLGLYNSPDSVLTFINDTGIFAISSNTKWISLDGRLIRDDYNYGITYSWGYNNTGRLGDGTTVNKSSPVSVIGGFTDWCQVSAGGGHSLGVRTNGTAWAWGPATAGRLGDGTAVNRSSPVSVVGGFTDWCQVSAGGVHSLGVRTNGTAWAWGQNCRLVNGGGFLGDGTTVSKSSPVSVIGGFTDWCQVSGGDSHSLGVRTNGTAWAWGSNRNFTLGDGTSVNKSSPVSVIGGFTDWCQVSAGYSHSLGVRTNGTAWAWGSNDYGMLGDGTIGFTVSPVSVVGGFTNWCRVSAGRYYSLGVRTNGTAWAWGSNCFGQLGDGTTVNKSSPVLVVGGFTDWCQVSAGFCHSLGVRTNGTAWAWGRACCGLLGDGTTVDKSSPISVIGGLTYWCQVSAGAYHSLGLKY